MTQKSNPQNNPETVKSGYIPSSQLTLSRETDNTPHFLREAAISVCEKSLKKSVSVTDWPQALTCAA